MTAAFRANIKLKKSLRAGNEEGNAGIFNHGYRLNFNYEKTGYPYIIFNSGSDCVSKAGGPT